MNEQTHEITKEIKDLKSLEDYVKKSEEEVFKISRQLMKVNIGSREDSFRLKRVIKDNNVSIH